MTQERAAEMNDAIYKLEKSLRGRMETMETEVYRQKKAGNSNEEIERLKNRVEHFVQSLMKLLRLPGLLRTLENRVQAIESRTK